jgi:(1->4)-alpha-D-glucan 1-alpha-D-glucosylmutase
MLGERISLGQLVLRLTAPGVPDVYQGDELWDLSLVDPDNRRPVDWDHRRDVLAQLRRGVAPTRDTAKLFTLHTLLDLRRRRQDAFAGDYMPLGDDPTTCAYCRGDDIVVAVATRDVEPRVPQLEGEWRNMLAPLGDIYAGAPSVFDRVNAR